MSLNKHICTQLIEKNKSFSQITLDDDYIVRDNKPDAIRVIYSTGLIQVEDVKTGTQGLWVSGKLCFRALYQSDDENHRLDSICGEIPFQEKIMMDEINESDDVSVHMDIEDLSIGIINSRKLSIRAVANVSAKQLSEEDVEFTSDISSMEYKQKTQEQTVLCLLQNTREELRLQKEMLLPNSKSNIGQITFYQVDFRNEEVILQDDSAQVKVDAQVWVLYRSETSGDYECYETVVPLNGSIDIACLHGDEIFWSKIRPVEVELEPRTDYDGENRMFGLDLILSVELQIYREEEICLLKDAYALDKELTFVREQIPFHQLLVKNISKIRLMEHEHLESNQPRILQICGSSGSITIDHIHKRENGVHVEGLLTVHILYNTTDDNIPIAHANSQISFEQFIEIPGFHTESLCWVEQGIEQLQVNLLDSSEFEIKSTLQISVLAMNRERISNIASMEEEMLQIDLLQKQPGIIGYIRRDGEDLWDVAKKYHATTDNMIEIGNKILVIKQVQ